MTFVKDDSQKLRPSLLPSDSLMEVVKVLEFGAKKYAKDNWKLCDDHSRYLDAAFRHLYAYSGGEQSDRESGLSHLSHACCNLLFLLHFQGKEELDGEIRVGDAVICINAADSIMLRVNTKYLIEDVVKEDVKIGGVLHNKSRFRKVKI